MNTSIESNTVSETSTVSCATDTQPSTLNAETASISAHQPSTLNSQPNSASQPSTNNSQPTFPRSRGETARAFSAFVTYFRLGHGRTLQAVADKLGEQLPTVKNWSSKYDWADRIHQFDSGTLQKEIDAEEEARQQAAADWAKRMAHNRELEWETGQKLFEVIRCWFENYGERDIERMRLSELSRAVIIASKMSHSALQHKSAQDKPTRSPAQDEMLALLGKIGGFESATTPAPQFESTLNSQP